MRHSLSKDTAFNGETTPRHRFLCSDSQCLPPGDPRILCVEHGSPITGKSFIIIPFFRCSKIPGETGEQEILDLKSSSEQIFDVGCPWKVDSAIPEKITIYKWKGWLPVSRNFYVLRCVKFTFANKIEAIHERSLVSVKVEPRSTSRLSSALFIFPQFYLLD